MTPRRLTLGELSVGGKSKIPATVSFTSGLNLLVGSSNTGKTFVFEAINFMLGGGEPLRNIPEARGYDHILLTITPTEGEAFQLRRGLHGGDFQLKPWRNTGLSESDEPRTLGAKHSLRRANTLSNYLLMLIGLDGRQVRSDQFGSKSALTFRDVAALTMVDEKRMIQTGSPIFGGQHQDVPREKSIFAFFLTGTDDSEIITVEKLKDRKARLNAEEKLVADLIEEKEHQLAELTPDPDDLANQAMRLEAAIAEATTAVGVAQSEISQAEGRRAAIFNERVEIRSRIMFLAEQRKRLDLLAEHYRSDRERLVAVLEAITAYHDLPEGACPLCSRPLEPTSRADDSAHERFEQSCRREIDKIDTLGADLAAAIREFDQEASTLRDQAQGITRELEGIDSELQQLLLPRAAGSRQGLDELVRKRTQVAQAEAVLQTLFGLRARLDEIGVTRKARVEKPSFENRATTSTAARFCEVVYETLKAWKYPGLKPIAFDTEKSDIVIGDQDRASNGKGYRAVTHAAFIIGLMRYCRMEGIPHPGFAILDTPLNPFKGPERLRSSERILDEVKLAFYEDLAGRKTEEQVIVIENEEPHESIAPRVTYYHFTGNSEIGRYGFFPIASTEPKGQEAEEQ